jgi:LmbE family N-acetylglucosaminyl deacetylase
MNPYQNLVSEYVRLAREGRGYPLGDAPPAPRPELAADAPKALFFAPHPDDECVSGGLALRLLREARLRVVNVLVTQGSNVERRAERLREAEAAARFLGYDLLATVPGSLTNITAQARAQDRAGWSRAVAVIAKILAENQPRVVFFPHERDWNGTHIGTHFLLMDALAAQPAGFECHVVETEFWGAMDTPNLMVESSVADVTDLVTALTFHAGEVRRNPYHLRLPAWLQDNVRRGGELVGGQGAAAPDFIFATLYRLGRWRGGKLENPPGPGRNVPCNMNPAGLFE